MSIFKSALSKSLSIILPALLFMSFANASSPTKEELYEGIEITVNVNTATAEELAVMLVGVGTKKAGEIVKYREAHGDFASIQELENVKGIGQATIEKNVERILLH